MRTVKLVSLVMVMVLIAGCAAVLASCSPKKEEKESKTLEEFLAASESGNAELDKINESLTNDNMEGSIEVKENAITMTMTLTQSIDEKYFDKMESALDDMLAKQGDSFRDAVNSLEEESEISGITMEFVLNNADGTEICRKTL